MKYMCYKIVLFSYCCSCRQSSEFRHPTFQAFAAEIVENLDPEKGTKMSSKFVIVVLIYHMNYL